MSGVDLKPLLARSEFDVAMGYLERDDLTPTAQRGFERVVRRYRREHPNQFVRLPVDSTAGFPTHVIDARRKTPTIVLHRGYLSHYVQTPLCDAIRFEATPDSVKKAKPAASKRKKK